MSIFNDKALKSVAEAAAKIMGEQLKGNQHKIDANKNGKVDAHDFKLLRAGKKPEMKKEEVEATEQEQLNEAFPTVADAKKRMDAGKTEHGSVTKTASGLVHKRDYKDDNDEDDAPKKKGGYGARQNFKRSTRVNESTSFTKMLELYNEQGLKVLAPIETEEMDIDGNTIQVIDADKVNGVVATIVEEPTNDEFTKEYEDQKASFEGKKKQPKVAAGKTTGVKEMPESVQQIDELKRSTLASYVGKASKEVAKSQSHAAKYKKDLEFERDVGHPSRARVLDKQRDVELKHAEKRQTGVDKALGRLAKEEVEQIDERELTTGESKKKEEYVKGMKKGLSGFKQRYGERAKSVMYATATKMAKKD